MDRTLMTTLIWLIYHIKGNETFPLTEENNADMQDLSEGEGES